MLARIARFCRIAPSPPVSDHGLLRSRMLAGLMPASAVWSLQQRRNGIRRPSPEAAFRGDQEIRQSSLPGEPSPRTLFAVG